jgi:phosphatidylglycerophosphate synthase
MLGSLLGAARWSRAWPSAALAVPSFLLLILASRGAHTQSGRFGLANVVTSVRLALAIALALPPACLSRTGAATLVVVCLLLDGLDGWLARARGDASPFGAHFDMETDALLVLMTTLRLWLGEGYGAWVLIAGGLRYGYVLSLWLAPGSGREAPRSRLGRSAFLLLMLGLLLGVLVHGSVGSLSIALGTLIVSWSFARSCYFSHVAS